MRKRTVQPNQRRGATIVLVAVLIVVVGGMAAFAVDLARIYSGVNEMQTGADAAALAGAVRLKKNPGLSAVANTQTFAAANTAFGTAIALAAGDVEGGFWDPATSAFTASGWPTANAVRVTTRATPTLAFGSLMNRPSVTASRGAVAWIANQASRDCIKPFGLNLSYLNTLLGQNVTTQAGINALATAAKTAGGQYGITIVAGPNINNPRGSPATPPTTFLALTGASSSRKEYQNAIIGLNCEGTSDYASNGTDSQIQTQPGQGNGDIPRTTVQALELNLPGNQGNGGVQTCAAQVGNDATCYAVGSSVPGVTITVAAVTQVSVNSATLNILMDFRLMCVFRGSSQPGSSRAQESCPWLLAAGKPATNYTQGTLVGFPMPSVALSGSGNTLGNTLSTSQKVILVR